VVSSLSAPAPAPSVDPLDLFPRDPIGALIRDWAAGDQRWPSENDGDPDLFHLGSRLPGKHSKRVLDRLEKYLGTSKKPAASESERKAHREAAEARRSITRTSIRVYRNRDKWLGGIAKTFCSFGGLCDITGQFCDGAIVCLSVGEQQRLRGLLHQSMEEMDIGLGLPQPEAEVLTIEQLKGRRFREVFVAPEINPKSTQLGGMLRVFGSARVGLHLVRCEPQA
jgi:hypothetical protein